MHTALRILALLVIFGILFAMILSAWKMRNRLGILGEFLVFLKERKLWWIIPLVVVFALAGLLVVIGAQSGVAGFIYTLF